MSPSVHERYRDFIAFVSEEKKAIHPQISTNKEKINFKEISLRMKQVVFEKSLFKNISGKIIAFFRKRQSSYPTF